ncbi:phage tail tape measure protein [Treponema phagedenis]|uniref:phage tail tape measure protein n=1 Tax=Treponema phagedenis TaxID=162 RepID=UPI0011EFD48C|nr:phage tail tape measure protein [Treponema phagedenis]TYT76434.1 phage tail tape measure protein [Treponema phagedenis]TYT76552.1 phage tail tape measure protein [Treponema phagedenis]TYT76853.1 phage tail tape measure protein [Treponema phagedenis]TYT77710.1 phage tail tape measure protein [Treponema phagedenis]
MATVRELIFKITGDNEKFKTAIDESKKALDDFNQKTKDASDLYGSIAKQAAIATTAIAAVGIATAKMAVEFNEGFGKVQTLIPGATERIAELEENVLNLSPAVGKTTKDLTEGLYEIISAFGDSADSAKNLELAAKGATAGGATTKESIKLLSAVTKAYGNTSFEAQKRVSDLAFTTLKLGQTSMSDLAVSMQRVTSMSNVLGVSQEELFAIFSSGTGVIGGAAEVSTKLSAVYTELQKPQERLAKSFKELGVATGEELIAKFGGLSGALQALKSVADKTGEPISNLFGSAEAGKLALYAAGEGAAKFASDLEAMNESAGATEQAFNDATVAGPNAFGFQLEQAKLNAQSFAIKLGQELIPSLQALLSPVFKLAEWLKNLNEEQLKLIVSVGKVLITFTAVTAGAFGLVKGIIAVQRGLRAMDAAFKVIGASNPFMLAIAGAAAAVIAIKEVCNWIDYAADKQRQYRLASLDKENRHAVEAQGVHEIAKQYGTLLAKKEKTTQETERLVQLEKKLADITQDYSETPNTNTFLASAKNEAAILEMNIAKKEELIEQKKREREESSKNANEKAVQRIDEEIKKTKEYIENARMAVAALRDLNKESFAPELEPEKLSMPEITSGKGKEKNEKTQAERLADLEKEYEAEVALIKKSIEDKKEQEELLLKNEESFYKKRLELLESFHKENVTKNLKENAEKNLTVEQSLAKAVGAAHETILEETKKTNEELDRLSDERHQKELEKIKKFTEEAKTDVELKVKLKVETGEISGATEQQLNRAEWQERANLYSQKRNELLDQYISLQKSSNKEEQEKAAAIKKQADNMGTLAEEAAKKASDAFAEATRKIADTFSEIGGIISSTFSQIADAAQGFINNKEEKRRQETAIRLAEIEREKNETLLEIDNELSERREQKQIEDAEREEQRRQEEYEKRQAESNRNIQELSGSFEVETNLIKIRNMEQQLEAARKKKAEDAAHKKAEDEKIKRDKEARMQEVALLNAKAQAEHEYAVTRITTENAAGDAAAKAAQEAAKWQKAQGVISMSIKAAIETAEAVAQFAIPNPVGGAMHTAAAVMAGVQIGVIAGQPLPPDYIQQALPPAPRPIKFAQGGIVMPSAAGTGITLPNGAPGLVAEAGIPEVILPLNLPNLETMFKAAGIYNTDNSASTNYSATYNVEVVHNQGDDLEESILNALRNHDREVYNIVEEGNKNWRV